MSATTHEPTAAPALRPKRTAPRGHRVRGPRCRSASRFTAGIASPFAFSKGKQAIAAIEADPDDYEGRTLANLGRVLGILGTVLLVTWLVLGLFTDSSRSTSSRVFRTALNQALGPNAIVYALAAIGLNVHFGYTGLLNFGQAGFMAVGAYGLAVSVVTFDLPVLASASWSRCSPRSCSRSCSACRRCGCGPTTWPSRPSPRPRSCASPSARSRPTTLRWLQRAHRLRRATYQDAQPLRRTVSTWASSSFSARDLWSMTRGWIAGRALPASSSGR